MMVYMTLAAVPFLVKLTSIIFALAALGLILLVLLQKGRGGGLGSAFGGAGNSLLGTKTGDFLTWVTVGFVGVFLVLAVLLGRYRPHVTGLEPVNTAPAASAPAQSTPQVQTEQPVENSAVADIPAQVEVNEPASN